MRQISAAILSAILLTTSVAPAQEKVTFNKDIRPILSDKCFFCHGPDSAKREADLRLDVRDVAIEKGAINLDDVAASELILRVLSVDPDQQMPPASAKLGRLTDLEIATLQAWIEQGAEYEGHWSFIPVSPDLLSQAVSAQKTAKRIDEIVLTELASRGLQRQPMADKNTLIRRLSFDLTGLPPTTTEIENFLNDHSPSAVNTLIERLLQSSSYGERMAVDWLDTARYADSFGFQVDRER